MRLASYETDKTQTLYRDEINQEYLSTILFAQRSGLGCLPEHLGLHKTEFATLIKLRFCEAQDEVILTRNSEQAIIRQELLELRQEEWQELYQLLSENKRGQDPSEDWLAKIIAAACLGSDHLWRDLGLQDRKSLGKLIHANFPSLAQKNTGNMRWKKFFYRQLCEAGGHFICRSPTCEICPTFEECFGDEL